VGPKWAGLEHRYHYGKGDLMGVSVGYPMEWLMFGTDRNLIVSRGNKPHLLLGIDDRLVRAFKTGNGVFHERFVVDFDFIIPSFIG